MNGRTRAPLAPGDLREAVVGPVAHGGHCIAHVDGWTVFVRHALPGERVRLRITEVTARIARADAVDVLDASGDRVVPPCAWAQDCGGCDLQHASLAAQRGLKRHVLVESITRFGGIDDDVVRSVAVVPVVGDDDGTRWRTRMRWAVSPAGRPALRAHRSHRLVEVDSCVIARPEVDVPALPAADPGAAEIVVAVGTDRRSAQGSGRVREEVGGRAWRVAADDFWQVHPGLPAALQEAVVRLGAPRPGERWWDLYSGAGLLAAALADEVGPGGRVEAVESAASSVAQARRALHDLAVVGLHQADVAAWLRSRPGRHAEAPDGIVLDPPRTGAGLAVVSLLARTGVARIVYVACDPVALGRDLGAFREAGYRLARLEAFDAFPMTHHVEAIALLEHGGRVESEPGIG